MLQEVKQTRKEKLQMYMNCTKEELASMLTERDMQESSERGNNGVWYYMNTIEVPNKKPLIVKQDYKRGNINITGLNKKQYNLIHQLIQSWHED